MKIVIFGGGSMGLAYAGLISKIASDVLLFVRRPEQVTAINKEGLTLQTSKGKQPIKVKATANPNDLKEADSVVMLVKNYDSESAAKVIAGNTKESCVIMTTESGIGVEEIYNEVCSPRKIIRAVSYLGCKRLSDTSTQIGENMNIVIQRPDESNKIAIELVELMQKAGFQVELSDNINDIVWKKMIVVTAQQATSALTGLTFGQLLESEDALALAKNLLGELKLVSKKENIHLSDDLMKIVKNNWKSLPSHKSSMYQDLKSGRKTEIDMMNGAIVRLGAKHGIPTPNNDAITRLVRLRQQMKNEQLI